jgi:signal transduction histidine kinase
LGVLAFGFAYPRRFSEADWQFFATLAAQCAAALERSRLAAAEQRLIQERDVLLATLSHDLKNPLTVIQMHTYMMRQSDSPDRRRADAIQQASDRMLRLIDNLNDLVRLGPYRGQLEAKPLAVGELAKAAAADVEPLLDTKRRVIRIDSASDLPPLLGDAARLQRALINVLLYSVRRAPADSVVRIALRQPAPSLLRIEVHDDGAPVGPTAAPLVFDAFSLAATGGSYTVGLGMAVAREIVEDHGGQLMLVPVAGGCVRIDLPARVAPQE